MSASTPSAPLPPRMAWLAALRTPRAARWGWAVFALLMTVGVVGLQTPWRPLFVATTPGLLALMAAAVALGHHPWNARHALALAGIWAAGMGVEALGVATGWPFGTYAYPPTLGPQLLQTPLVIGLNWVVLVYGTAALANRLLPTTHPLVKALLGATAMLGFDLLLEPVAIDLNYWTWAGGHPPPANYLAWWVVALLLHLGGRWLRLRWASPLAVPVLGAYTAFMLAMNLI